ncbi:hypothetical protein OPV22_026291 [Ensete ventricosum]|uniref:Uncharacterized protein n=1 Tax=Ensete ventricosum TaxID=4639 RepID=A0AAV8QG36_ENSVE|nr:hypothetical protein OPV22_026291 [Ensete ventricosum]
MAADASPITMAKKDASSLASFSYCSFSDLAHYLEFEDRHPDGNPPCGHRYLGSSNGWLFVLDHFGAFSGSIRSSEPESQKSTPSSDPPPVASASTSSIPMSMPTSSSVRSSFSTTTSPRRSSA